MKTEWIVIAALVALAGYAVVAFNGLIRHRNLVREGWSGVDVQLRRRSDLIPNLVQSVKAYAAHERSLFEDIAERRSATLLMAARPEKAAAEQALQGSLGRLVAVAEAYPELKADQNFLKLQEQLAEIEDQLQMARRYYNGTVRNLNISIQSVPDMLVARPLGFREEPFFELESRAEAAAPQIGFPGGKP
jgi:LemA protein